MARDAKAEGVEVTFDGGERSGTRWANSTITANLIQFDQNLSITVRVGQKTGNATTREFDDDSLKAAVDEAKAAAEKACDNPNLPPLVKGPQEYIQVDAARPEMVDFGPGAREVGEAVRRHLRKERRPRPLSTSGLSRHRTPTRTNGSWSPWAYQISLPGYGNPSGTAAPGSTCVRIAASHTALRALVA